MMKNASLAKHIGDASWHALITQLDYKTREQGKYLVKIGPWFASSRICHVCQHKLGAMPLSVRSWECPACQAHHDRNINVAAVPTEGNGTIRLHPRRARYDRQLTARTAAQDIGLTNAVGNLR